MACTLEILVLSLKNKQIQNLLLGNQDTFGYDIKFNILAMEWRLANPCECATLLL